MLPFLTAYDPLGGSSGSIDPLGALQAYGSLADMLLPGVTTITTRSRYLSMLCAALDNAENQPRFLPGASGLAQRRKAVEPFERLWVLACVAARECGHGHGLAADGLRGITYAEKAYRDMCQSGKKVSPEFKLLKYQSRTGAVGTYWTTLIGGELAHANTGALNREGKDLARLFPKPPLTCKDLSRLADPEDSHRVKMNCRDLVKWSEDCHLVAAGKEEREKLGEALTAHDHRDCLAQALRKIDKSNRGLPDTWNTQSLEQLRGELATTERAVGLGLPTVVQAIIVMEQFHEAVLAVFEALLWWGTMHPSKPRADLLDVASVQNAVDRSRDTALSLLRFRSTCECETPINVSILKAIHGVTSFAKSIADASSRNQIVDEIVCRHHYVQSGKVDGGVPKRDWVSLDHGRILRPLPRFQRNDPPPAAVGTELTHPYRLESFIHMLRENGYISRVRQKVT